jgi:hypothetical protein
LEDFDMMWFRFFVGSPQRFLMTLVFFVSLLVFVNLNPGLLNSACEQLMAELTPLFMWTVQLGFVVVVLIFMVRAAFGKK